MIDQEISSRRRCWVVKIGSSLLTSFGNGLARESIHDWAGQIHQLRQDGIDVVLVSSGSIAEGMARMGWTERPHALYKLQAAAAVGQMGLIQAYESAFKEYGVHTAQILLTHEDLSHRRRYLNARSTLRTLLEMKIVPIVNENDTVVTDEIRFGDNDTLGALVANLVEAERLVILTDTNGLYDTDPTVHANAKLIETAQAGDLALEKMAGAGAPGKLGRGGMLTKIQAAAKAARSGATTVIANGQKEQILLAIKADAPGSGTWLAPAKGRSAARKQWLASHMQVRGRLTLDAGAVSVLRTSGKSLLPVGVVRIEGEFRRGEVVECRGPDGVALALGLVNYDHEESDRIKGRPSSEIEGILGYVDEPELIHRDNLVLL